MSFKYLFLSVLLISSIVFVVNPCYSDDINTVYSRIIRISWPPEHEIDSGSSGDYTRFYFDADYQIINNGSSFVITVRSAPYIIPRMNTSLVNSSLNSGMSYVFLWPVWDVTIEKGITNKSTSVSFYISEYANQTVPLGNYTFWFDTVSNLGNELLIIPFYTTLNITDCKTIITHQGTNTIITYPEQINETSISFISILTTFVILNVRKRKKNNLKNQSLL